MTTSVRLTDQMLLDVLLVFDVTIQLKWPSLVPVI